jgi:hypothetical protein
MVPISRPLASALLAAAGGLRLILYSGRLEARSMTKNFQSWKNTYLHLARRRMRCREPRHCAPQLMLKERPNEHTR